MMRRYLTVFCCLALAGCSSDDGEQEEMDQLVHLDTGSEEPDPAEGGCIAEAPESGEGLLPE